jgi:predicted Zn-dependent peptidase
MNQLRFFVSSVSSVSFVSFAALVLSVLVSAGCGGVGARQANGSGETLPGRIRPLFEHGWAHPRDLTFAENRFAPPDPTAALVVTPSKLRAYVIPDSALRMVQVTAAAPFGRSSEGINEAGAAELLSRLLSQQIDERLGEAVLSRVQVDQDVDVTRFTLQVLAGDWPTALAALIGALREPRFDSRAIQGFRTGPGFARQTRGLGGVAFRPAVELSRLLSTYPIAPPDAGLGVRPDAVRRIASIALRPASLAVGVGGGVSREPVERALHELTAGWETGGVPAQVAPIPRAGTSTASRVRAIEETGYTTWIAVGHPIPPIDAADETAVAVMTDLLNIRLTIAVREIRGLANATQLVVPATTRSGSLLHVRSGARPESIAPIIRFSIDELTRLREPTGTASPEELEQVKGGLVLGKWQGSLDSAPDASATYATETARFGSLDHLLKWPAAVRSVTAQAVTAAARKYINPAALGWVLIGQIDEARKARHPRWPVALDELMETSAGTR